MNKLTKTIGAIALALGLAVGGAAVPAQATSYTFTTYCSSGKHPKVYVYAASYVYTTLRTPSLSLTLDSGYGNWTKQFTYNTTMRVDSYNGSTRIDYICN